MVKKNSIKLFGDDKIRAIWDDEQEKWYFSIVDVIAVLTESPNPQTYWRVLKKRLKDEGNETVTNCNSLKMRAADGKMRLTDVADTEQLFSSLFTPFSHDFGGMRVFHSCVICSRSSTSAWLFSSRSIFSFEFLRRGV